MALNNMNCPKWYGRYPDTNQTSYPDWLYEEMLMAAKRLNDNCEMDYSDYQLYLKFLDSIYRLSDYTYPNLCCCHYEIQTCSLAYKSNPDGEEPMDEFYVLEQLMQQAGEDPILFRSEIARKNSPTNHYNAPTSSSDTPTWVIVVIITGMIAVIVLVTVISIWLRGSRSKPDFSDGEEDTFVGSDLDYDSLLMHPPESLKSDSY